MKENLLFVILFLATFGHFLRKLSEDDVWVVNRDFELYDFQFLAEF